MSKLLRPARRLASRRPASDKLRRFHGVLRRRAQLEPGRADHRPGRGGSRRPGHPLRRHQSGSRRSARTLYDDIYCRRGRAENHIKSWKTHLAADRTSCSSAIANQFRLFLHAGAYWLMWSLRALAPKRSTWRVAQFDTLRLKLIKIAARVIEMKTMIRVPRGLMPRSGCPTLGSGTHTAPRRMTDGA